MSLKLRKMESNNRIKILNVALFLFVLAANAQNTKANCSEGDIQVDPTDCTSFYVCCGGELVPKSCESGLYFDQDSSECKPDNGQCIGTQPPPGCDDNETPAPCKEGDLKLDPTDCTAYYICAGGVYIKRECVSGSYFDDVLGICTPDDKGVCIPTPAPDCDENDTPTPKDDEGTVTPTPKDEGTVTPTPKDEGTVTPTPKDEGTETPTPKDEGTVSIPPPTSAPCTEGDKKVNAQDCASYFICLESEDVLKICESGDYFDKSTLECIPDVDGKCIPNGSDAECENIPNNGLIPVPGNCSGFYQCLYGKVIELTCPNNLHFNNVTKQCDYPENAGCEWPSVSAPSTGPSGTACESHGVCLGQRDGTMFASSSNACSAKYIVCQCECEINLSCDASLMFNEKVQSCDWPQNFDC